MVWPAALWLAGGLALLPSCDAAGDGTVDLPARPGEGAAGPDRGTDVGSVAMSLTLGGGFLVDSVSYDISGNGFHKADSIPVARSTTISAIATGIPFGRNYRLQLTAEDAAHRLTPCVGAASFDLASAVPVSVPVHLTCRELPVSVPVPRTASLAIAALLLALGTLALPRRGRR